MPSDKTMYGLCKEATRGGDPHKWQGISLRYNTGQTRFHFKWVTVLEVSLLTESAVLLRYESIILYEKKLGEEVSFSASIHNDFGY